MPVVMNEVTPLATKRRMRGTTCSCNSIKDSSAACTVECAPMAELPGITRETLDVDVVIVGAGPAGLAAAYRLAELIKAHNDSAADKKVEGISIAVLEKGKEIGSHGISGAVMDPRGIAELMPDWLQRGCPVESPVTDDGFWLMSENWKFAAPILPPPLQNHGNYVISIGELVRWLAPICAEA